MAAVTAEVGGKTKIKPLGERVLIEMIEEEEQTQGGIIIPDSARERPQTAKVIELGTGRKDDDGKDVPFHVKQGDTVIVSKYGGTEVKLGGNTYTLVREDDILGVLE